MSNEIRMTVWVRKNVWPVKYTSVIDSNKLYRNNGQLMTYPLVSANNQGTYKI